MSKQKIVIVADFFADEYHGGAELSTEALIECAPAEVEFVRIKSINVNNARITEHAEAFWIFTNFSAMPFHLIPRIVNTLQYAVVEYDYKYCWYRNPMLHKMEMHVDCNCENQFVGALFENAKAMIFMSNAQKTFIEQKLGRSDCHIFHVLGSFFSDSTLAKLEALRSTPKGYRWAVVGSGSKGKGTAENVKFCQDNELPFEFYHSLGYAELLHRLSKCKGLVFRPIGNDTCPRLVIEARLMGLELEINEFVEHTADRWWWDEDIVPYLKNNKLDFWKVINGCLEKVAV
jgi:hypothetical protein